MLHMQYNLKENADYCKCDRNTEQEIQRANAPQSCVALLLRASFRTRKKANGHIANLRLHMRITDWFCWVWDLLQTAMSCTGQRLVTTTKAPPTHL